MKRLPSRHEVALQDSLDQLDRITRDIPVATGIADVIGAVVADAKAVGRESAYESLGTGA